MTAANPSLAQASSSRAEVPSPCAEAKIMAADEGGCMIPSTRTDCRKNSQGISRIWRSSEWKDLPGFP